MACSLSAIPRRTGLCATHGGLVGVRTATSTSPGPVMPRHSLTAILQMELHVILTQRSRSLEVNAAFSLTLHTQPVQRPLMRTSSCKSIEEHRGNRLHLSVRQ